MGQSEIPISGANLRREIMQGSLGKRFMFHYDGVRPYAHAGSLLQNQEWIKTRNFSMFLASKELQRKHLKDNKSSRKYPKCLHLVCDHFWSEQESLETMYIRDQIDVRLLWSNIMFYII